MGANTLFAISELSHHLENISEEIDLVSFDIFDTLLERHVEPPDAVKITAARRLAASYAEGKRFNAVDILSTRNSVETELRERALRNGFDYECAFTDIAAGVARRLSPENDAELCAAFVECEMEAEKEALYPKPGVAEVLAMVKSRGKRVVAISDMYLDGTLIGQLLTHFGLARFIDFIYVSADVKLGKYSGRLFKHVLKAERVAPARVVHLGDHIRSDFSVPKALGIRSFFLRDGINLQRRQEGYVLHWLAERNPIWRGRRLLQMIPAPVSKDFYYRYGYSHLGPIFCAFVLGVLEEVRKRRTAKVFFLAREGDLFRVLYKKMAPALADSAPPDCYLYVSRKAVFLPASWKGLSRNLLNTVLYNPKQKGFSSLANALGIPAAEFQGVAGRFGLTAVDEPIRGWSDADFTRLLQDPELQDIVIRYARPARVLLRRYLEQEGFFGEQKIAYVDIGWNGTIQNAIRAVFGEESDFPGTTGFYLSFNDGFKYGFNSDEAKGVLYDSSTSPLSHNVFAGFEELFENSARAFHGTTTGYFENPATGRVEPQLKEDGAPDRDAEKLFEARTAALRQGVLDFADGFIKAVRLTGYQFAEIKPLVIEIARQSVVYPTNEEVSHFLEMIHTEDLGSDNVMTFSEYRMNGPTALLRPRRFLRLLRASNWKYGTARTVGLPGFNYLLRRVELAMIRRRSPIRVAEPKSGPLFFEGVLFRLVRWGCFPALSRARKIVMRKTRS